MWPHPLCQSRRHHARWHFPIVWFVPRVRDRRAGAPSLHRQLLRPLPVRPLDAGGRAGRGRKHDRELRSRLPRPAAAAAAALSLRRVPGVPRVDGGRRGAQCASARGNLLPRLLFAGDGARAGVSAAAPGRAAAAVDSAGADGGGDLPHRASDRLAPAADPAPGRGGTALRPHARRSSAAAGVGLVGGPRVMGQPVTVPYAAELLGCTSRSVLRRAAEGSLAAVNQAGKYRGRSRTMIDVDSLPEHAQRAWRERLRLAPVQAIEAAPAPAPAAAAQEGAPEAKLPMARFRFAIIEPLLTGAWARKIGGAINGVAIANRGDYVRALAAGIWREPSGAEVRYS